MVLLPWLVHYRSGVDGLGLRVLGAAGPTDHKKLAKQARTSALAPFAELSIRIVSMIVLFEGYLTGSYI